MHSYILEDWLTVRGPGSDTITQDEMRWLDLEAFQDAVFYVECRSSTASPTITFQTSPCKDDSLFAPFASTGLNGSTTPSVVPALLANASPPLARFVRWQIVGPIGTPWDATFRVIVAANSPGM